MIGRTLRTDSKYAECLIDNFEILHIENKDHKLKLEFLEINKLNIIT